MIRFITVSILLSAILPLFGASLEYSGALGQSQPEKFTPVPFTPVYSAAADSSGIYFITGPYQRNGELWRLTPGSRTAERISSGTPGPLISDGKNIYLLDNTRLYTLKNGTKSAAPVLDLKRKFDRMAIAGDETKQAFGGVAKYFAYDRKAKQIHAWKADGSSLGVVVDLAKTTPQSPFYSMGFLPDAGYLIASTSYPELRTYRFTPDGAAQSGNWPLRGSASAFFPLDGVCWGVDAGATTFRDHPVSSKREKVGGENDRYTYAICKDANNGFFLATSQGLKHYRTDSPAECDFRIGGLPGITALAVSGKHILAVCGGAIHRLLLDDLPDAPLLNAGNEAWRVGANWSSSGIAALPNGDGTFLILDKGKKAVWKFDPSRTRWGDKNRMRLQKGSFRAPTDMALLNGQLIVADSGKLNVKNDLAEPVVKVDVFPSGEIIAANAGKVFYLKDGKTLWSFPGKISDIAVLGDCIAVSGDKLLLLDRNGKLLDTQNYHLTALAASGKWLLAASPERKGILRFQLKQEKK